MRKEDTRQGSSDELAGRESRQADEKMTTNEKKKERKEKKNVSWDFTPSRQTGQVLQATQVHTRTTLHLFEQVKQGAASRASHANFETHYVPVYCRQNTDRTFLTRFQK